MWTQKAISDWADQTFGDITNWPGLVDKVKGEVQELEDEAQSIEAADNQEDYEASFEKMVEEGADVIITLMRIFEYRGVHFQDVIDKKMEVNIKRKWKKFGDGNGQHE